MLYFQLLLDNPSLNLTILLLLLTSLLSLNRTNKNVFQLHLNFARKITKVANGSEIEKCKLYYTFNDGRVRHLSPLPGAAQLPRYDTSSYHQYPVHTWCIFTFASGNYILMVYKLFEKYFKNQLHYFVYLGL